VTQLRSLDVDVDLNLNVNATVALDVDALQEGPHELGGALDARNAGYRH